ncbi:hypothetical protein [Vibrio phage vB_VpaS_AL-2]|nr:hypothetical protein [Vibrio phage vB_VpaS_AL-2]
MPKLSSNAKVAAHATMQVLKTTEQNNGLLAPGLEGLSNGYLAGFTERVMKETLKAAAIEKGRTGWWSEHICTIDNLMDMRAKALADNDHASVINFTAMIMYREAAGECIPPKKIQCIYNPQVSVRGLFAEKDKGCGMCDLGKPVRTFIRRGIYVVEVEDGSFYTPRYDSKKYPNGEHRLAHQELIEHMKTYFNLELN